MNVFSLFNNEQWTAVSAMGTVAQALIAVLGLGFISYQVREARKAADVQGLQAFYTAVTERERGFSTADTDDDKERTFYELVNYLEIQVMALRGNLYPNVTRKLVRLKLLDASAFIQLSDFWFAHLKRGRSTPAAFEDLFRFMKKNQKNIDKIKALHPAVQPSNSEAGNSILPTEHLPPSDDK